MRRARNDNPEWDAARKRVLERSRGVCEARAAVHCWYGASTVHHVLRRSQGGANDDTLLLAVCNACHDHIHMHPAWSYRHGMLRRQGTTTAPFTHTGCPLSCTVDHAPED